MRRDTTEWALSEPPDGVVAGEDVDAATEPDERERHRIERMAAELKTRPGYRDRPDDELRELAKQKLGDL